MTTFYCIRFDSRKLQGQVSVFISHRNRVARLYPQVLASFSALPTTRRATLEVFDRSNDLTCPFYNPLARTAGKTQLYCCVYSFTWKCVYSMFQSNGYKRHISYPDASSRVACRHYLATAASLPSRFLL
jgi:hypothetical protein